MLFLPRFMFCLVFFSFAAFIPLFLLAWLFLFLFLFCCVSLSDLFFFLFFLVWIISVLVFAAFIPIFLLAWFFFVFCFDAFLSQTRFFNGFLSSFSVLFLCFCCVSSSFSIEIVNSPFYVFAALLFFYCVSVKLVSSLFCFAAVHPSFLFSFFHIRLLFWSVSFSFSI